MLALGVNEAWCSSLVSEAEAVAAAKLVGDDPKRLVKLTNPMSRESEWLRPNLVPGLLRAVALNLRQGATSVRLFEVGTGFIASASAEPLPQERLMIAAVLAGPRLRHTHDPVPTPGGAYDQGRGGLADAKGLGGWLGDAR
jgi:phenylalanyl-tRNA synthetase beta chain